MEAPANTMIPYAWPTLMGGQADWAYQTTPQPGLLGHPTLMPHGRVVGGSSQINGLLWTRGDPSDFDAWAHGERGHALVRYRERLHQALSRQDDARLTQRAVVGAMESIYDAALDQLDRLSLRGAALVPRVLEPFAGLGDAMLAEAVIFNNPSCARSNVPAEHRPSGAYLHTIRRDLELAWQAFEVATHARLSRTTLPA